MDNPWKVDSIQAFSCLKCPECSFNTKEEDWFQDHAVKNHPSSSLLFYKCDRLFENSAKSGSSNDNLTEEVSNSSKRLAENIECTESEAKKAKNDSDDAAETSQNTTNNEAENSKSSNEQKSTTIQKTKKNKKVNKNFVRGIPKNLKTPYGICSDFVRSEFFMNSADLRDGITERLKCVICDENGPSYDTISDVQSHIVLDHIGENTEQFECWWCKCDAYICEIRPGGLEYECPKCLRKTRRGNLNGDLLVSHEWLKVIYFSEFIIFCIRPKNYQIFHLFYVSIL